MIYANHAATSWPKSPEVLKAVNDALAGCPLEAERSGNPEALDIREECRHLLAELFNAPDPRRIVLTSGATHALNLVLQGLTADGRHAVTTTTEHNSVLRPLHRACSESGLNVTYVPCDTCGFVDPEHLISQIRNETTFVVLNHSSNVTGAVQDILPVACACKERNILLVVDASQSAGCIPIDVRASMIDILVFAGHKGIGGPPGTGGVVLAADPDMRPLMVGGTGIRSELPEHPWEYPLRYEAGTPNTCGIAGLAAAVRECLETGVLTLQNRLFALAQDFDEALSHVEGIQTFSCPEKQRLPVQSMVMDGMSVSDLGYILQESFGIICRSGLHCAPKIHSGLGTLPEGTLRISLGRSSTKQELATVVDTLTEIQQSL